MKHQLVAIMTSGVFIISSLCCYSLKPVKPEVLSSPRAAGIEIRQVDKKIGEVIEFAKDNPGRIIENAVVGNGRMTRAVEIVEVSNGDIKEKFFRKDKNCYTIVLLGGKTYAEVKTIVEQGERSMLYVIRDIEHPKFSAVHILIADAENVLSKQFNFMKTLYSFGVPFVIEALLAISIKGGW